MWHCSGRVMTVGVNMRRNSAQKLDTAVITMAVGREISVNLSISILVNIFIIIIIIQ